VRQDALKPDKIKVQRTSVSGSLVTVLPKFGKGGFVPPQPNKKCPALSAGFFVGHILTHGLHVMLERAGRAALSASKHAPA
jgi:hypothetical protein